MRLRMLIGGAAAMMVLGAAIPAHAAITWPNQIVHAGTGCHAVTSTVTERSSTGYAEASMSVTHWFCATGWDVRGPSNVAGSTPVRTIADSTSTGWTWEGATVPQSGFPSSNHSSYGDVVQGHFRHCVGYYCVDVFPKITTNIDANGTVEAWVQS